MESVGLSLLGNRETLVMLRDKVKQCLRREI